MHLLYNKPNLLVQRLACASLYPIETGLCQSLSTRPHFTRMHRIQVRAVANAAQIYVLQFRLHL
jgi:hypothetical protein